MPCHASTPRNPPLPTSTKAAFSRALRAIAAACAELVGPSQWGVKDDSSPVREDANLPLDYFFQVITSHPFGPYHCHESLTASTQLKVLDVYLPFSRMLRRKPAHLLSSLLRPLRTGSLRPSADENLRAGGAAGNAKRLRRPRSSVVMGGSPVISRRCCVVVMSRYRRPR
jgi:hypothetical protein